MTLFQSRAAVAARAERRNQAPGAERRAPAAVATELRNQLFTGPGMPVGSLAGIFSTADNASGEYVDPLRGLGIPTIYRCISIIATVAASSTLNAVHKDQSRSPWQDWQNLISYTPYEITELIVTHLAGWGNFFAFPVTSNGKLLDLQPIFPGSVDVRLENGQKVFRVRQAADKKGNVAYQDFTSDQVFHIPFLGYDGVKGMSPIMWAAQPVGIALSADRITARYNANGQLLGGVIKVKAPLSSAEQAQGIKESWRRSFSGGRNTGEVAVMDADSEFQSLSIDPTALQLVESRGFQTQELARIFGVPLTMLSTASTGYGDAIDAQQEGLVAYTVRAYTDRIEQRLGREFTPRGTCVEFDLDGVLRGATLERYQSYQTGIMSGWLTRDEVRQRERLQSLEKFGLDEPLVPASVNGQPSNPPLQAPSEDPPPVPVSAEASASNDSDDEDEASDN